MSKFEVHGAAHITGGGFIENIPRMFNSSLQANIKLGSWKMPKLFDYLCGLAGLTQEKAYNTFNMGIGMVLCVKDSDKNAVAAELQRMGEEAYIIGEVAERTTESGVQFV